MRWIKSKSIGELIIAPMAEMLTDKYDLDVKGGCFVKSLHFNSKKNAIDKVTYFDTTSKREVVIDRRGRGGLGVGRERFEVSRFEFTRVGEKRA